MTTALTTRASKLYGIRQQQKRAKSRLPSQSQATLTWYMTLNYFQILIQRGKGQITNQSHPMQVNDLIGSQFQITHGYFTDIKILLLQSQDGLNLAPGLQEWRWCSFKDWFRPTSVLANDYCHFVFPTGLVITSSKLISTEYASLSSIIILCFYKSCHDRPPNHSTFWWRPGWN